MKKIETRTGWLWLREDGIIQMLSKPKIKLDLKDAENAVAVGAKIANGRKMPMLLDISGTISVTREARQYFAGQVVATYSLAQALLVKSHVSRVIGNIFVGLNKTVCPTKLFNSEPEAIQWLKEFID